MVNKEFFAALDAFEKERRISKESLIESLEAGMISAFKKEYGDRVLLYACCGQKNYNKIDYIHIEPLSKTMMS